MPWDLDDLEDDPEFAAVTPEQEAHLESLATPKTGPMNCLEGLAPDIWDKAPSEPTAIVVLDIDGVLHAMDAQEEAFFAAPQLDELRRVLEASDARIVLSSTWRLSEGSGQKAIDALVGAGIRPPIGATPDLLLQSEENDCRAQEIMEWLECNSDLVDSDRWVAIDDIPLAQWLPSEHVVTTDSHHGLTSELADEAISKLSRRSDEGAG